MMEVRTEECYRDNIEYGRRCPVEAIDNHFVGVVVFLTVIDNGVEIRIVILVSSADSEVEDMIDHKGKDRET